MGIPRSKPRLRRSGLAIGGGVMALIVALACVVLLMLVGIIPSFGTKEVNRSQPPVLQKLEALEEFKAASGTFDVVVDVEKDVDGLPSIIAGERTLMVATGDVDALVDFSGLKADAIEIDESTRSVTITLPPPKLSDTRIDNSKTRVYSRQRGILNRLEDLVSDQPIDDQPLYVEAEDQLEEAAANSDLSGLAKKNTKDMLRSMLASLGYDDVTVVFSEDAPVAPDGTTVDPGANS